MEPITWIYLALLAASTAASYKAQKKTNQARAQVAGEERDRRKKQQEATEASAADTANQMVGMRDKEKARAAELAEVYREQAPTTTTTDAGTRLLSTDAPRQATSTVQSIDRARQSAVDEHNQKTDALAQLGAFGDVFQESNRASARNSQDIGMEQGFMQGWQQNVLPALYGKANTAGKDWATTADILKLAAAVTSFGAMAGPGTAAKTATDAGSAGAEIGAARFGDFARGFGEGGSIPFGGTYGLAEAQAALKAADLAELGLTTADVAGGVAQGAGQYAKPLWWMQDPNWFLKPGMRGRSPMQPGM